MSSARRAPVVAAVAAHKRSMAMASVATPACSEGTAISRVGRR